jgi:hypothetical protein
MEIRPTKIVSMVQYTIAQHPNLVLFIRERMSSSLQQMLTDVEEIEDNISACGRLLNRVWDGDLEQERVYEQKKSYLDTKESKEGYGHLKSDLGSYFHHTDASL